MKAEPLYPILLLGAISIAMIIIPFVTDTTKSSPAPTPSPNFGGTDPNFSWLSNCSFVNLPPNLTSAHLCLYENGDYGLQFINSFEGYDKTFAYRDFCLQTLSKQDLDTNYSNNTRFSCEACPILPQYIGEGSLKPSISGDKPYFFVDQRCMAPSSDNTKLPADSYFTQGTPTCRPDLDMTISDKPIALNITHKIGGKCDEMHVGAYLTLSINGKNQDVCCSYAKNDVDLSNPYFRLISGRCQNSVRAGQRIQSKDGTNLVCALNEDHNTFKWTNDVAPNLNVTLNSNYVKSNVWPQSLVSMFDDDCKPITNVGVGAELENYFYDSFTCAARTYNSPCEGQLVNATGCYDDALWDEKTKFYKMEFIDIYATAAIAFEVTFYAGKQTSAKTRLPHCVDTKYNWDRDLCKHNTDWNNPANFIFNFTMRRPENDESNTGQDISTLKFDPDQCMNFETWSDIMVPRSINYAKITSQGGGKAKLCFYSCHADFEDKWFVTSKTLTEDDPSTKPDNWPDYNFQFPITGNNDNFFSGNEKNSDYSTQEMDQMIGIDWYCTQVAYDRIQYQNTWSIKHIKIVDYGSDCPSGQDLGLNWQNLRCFDSSLPCQGACYPPFLQQSCCKYGKLDQKKNCWCAPTP